MQGLDIPDIEVVIQYGISRDVPTTLQRGGRGGRGPKDALFLIMYEPWVNEIDLSEINVPADADPDHPNVGELSRYSTKQARLGLAMIKIIQLDEVCLRLLFAVYLKDQSLEGVPGSSPAKFTLTSFI
jgi:superfamily II DNA helicase RecQ